MKNKWVLMAALLPIAALGTMGAVTSTWYDGLGTWTHYEAQTGETILTGSPVWISDDFTGKGVDTTYTWNFQGDNSGAAALTAGVGGIVRLTTGASDDNADQLAGGLVLAANKCSGVEARFALNDVAHTGLCFGLSDSIAESAGNVAMGFNTGTLSAASDFVGFVWDSDETTTVLHGVAVKANVDATDLDFTTALANGTYHILKVLFSSANGQADFYIDGACVGGIPEAVTVTTPLCPYISLINHEGSANTIDIDYIKAWSGR